MFPPLVCPQFQRRRKGFNSCPNYYVCGSNFASVVASVVLLFSGGDRQSDSTKLPGEEDSNAVPFPGSPPSSGGGKKLNQWQVWPSKTVSSEGCSRANCAQTVAKSISELPQLP